MLKRIRVEGYKTLRDVEVRLTPLTVIVGPNAAGKSNFLDALQLLSKLASARTLKEAFDPPYRGKPLESFTFGESGLRGLLDNDEVRFSIEVDFDVTQPVVDLVERRVREMRDPENDRTDERAPKITERSMRYRIEVEMKPRSGVLRVSDEFLAALKSDGSVSQKRKPFLERVGEQLRLRFERQSHPKYFERYLDHSILSMPHYSPHYPHVVAARESLSSWAFFYFEPRERMRIANPVKETHQIGMMGEDLPAYLNTLKTLEPARFRAIEKALRHLMPQIGGIDTFVNEIGEVELRLVEYGTTVPARILSEGTLRILGMLALSGSKMPPPVIGFEEPENGVHPRRVELVAEMLKARGRGTNTQYVVTTHSPLLADMVRPDDLLIVRRGESGTEIRSLDSWGPLANRNEIERALEEGDLEPPSFSDRMLRGDFDAA